MGVCCSKDPDSNDDGAVENDATEDYDDEENDEADRVASIGEHGSLVRFQGASKYISMHTQKGRKVINQDAMVVWEDFTGNRDTFFCGVFDGHGPHGHKVARHVRDALPSRLSASIRSLQLHSFKYSDVDTRDEDDSDHHDNDASRNNQDTNAGNSEQILLLSSWEAWFIKCFREMDEELNLDASIDSFCSGSTAVTVVKQGKNLIIANLGDSRAVLCSRDDANQLVPIQLTVDLKPNTAGEAERIKNSNGRVFAVDREPGVLRIWMPNDDCPGLAMARAFGDFCLKDYGLISIPEVSYRRLTKKDEFVVLATDGVWDVLTNYEVMKIIASARNRSLAAKKLAEHAVRAWRKKSSGSRVDDIAVVCLFFKRQTQLARSFSQVTQVSINHTELAETYSHLSLASINHSEIVEIARIKKNTRLGNTRTTGTPVL